MLAVVHHTPDHRQSSSNPNGSRSSRPHPRKQLSSSFPSSSSRSASTSLNVASNRHSTVVPPSSKYNLYIPSDHPAPQPPPSPIPKSSRIPTSQSQPVFDIHSYPSPELLPLLASLLTQIAATNDNLTAASPVQTEHPSSIPSRTSLPSVTDLDAPIWRTLTTASRTAISTPSSSLTFHARNVPTITLEAYLLRILKYCPTTNEVFLSLLVYFDRMSKLSNEAMGKAFVIDSYNIHRLVIAGVTVASKFFSDVFYTNSRYAKVGGLPQAELNQLELQFLLLNDFRLVIHTDEMQRYAEQLILFSKSFETSSSSSPSASSSSHTLAHTVSLAATQGHRQGPSEAMGAIDAYGGKIGTTLGPERYTNGYSHQQPHHAYSKHPTPIITTNNRTPHVRPRGSSPSPSTHSTSTAASYETEPEPETEPETETDGGSTTDDEPTIRPPHSCADSEDDRSLFGGESVDDDTGDEGGDEPEGEFGGEADGGKGDLTPERKRIGDRHDKNRFRDESMASP